jgi:murein DD-endopeptidase MepM/ murein hydrolase activator NlpD
MRILIVLLLAASLAACASTPRRGSQQNQISASLTLCPGTHISNAPKIDSNRQIIGYKAQTKILGTSLYRAPVDACVSSGYGPRKGGAGSFHSGVDLFTRSPSPIYAGGDGVVEAVKTMRGYGKTILIRHHRKLKTRYAHLSRYASGLRPGDHIVKGDYIGDTGKTGNATAIHLHYEILVHGRAKNPLTVGD